MLKKIVLVVVILGLVLGFSGMALAEERVEFEELRLTAVRAEPVDVPRYVEAQVDFWAEVIARLLKTGKPNAIFGEEAFGLEVTVEEGLIWDKLNWVAGFTFLNEEPSKFFTGFQYTGLTEWEGGIWEIFKRCEPTLYLIEGDWYFGIGYEFR